MMIEFGADVTSKDVETLRRHMPKTMADGSDWSEFLIRYSRPDKRQELREDRKNRIRDWPEKFGGTNSHRKLMGLDPLLYASY